MKSFWIGLLASIIVSVIGTLVFNFIIHIARHIARDSTSGLRRKHDNTRPYASYSLDKIEDVIFNNTVHSLLLLHQIQEELKYRHGSRVKGLEDYINKLLIKYPKK